MRNFLDPIINIAIKFMKSPHVVIGLPVYNGENYLCQAIDSILAQSFTDFQIIISDNASTDSTSDICHRYAQQDNRIIYHRHPKNIGAGKNFNFVFQPGNAPYFKWATHDDVLEADYLHQCLELLARDTSLSIAHSPGFETNEHGVRVKTYDHEIRLNGDRPQDRFWRILWAVYFTEVFGVMRSDLIAKTKLYGSYAGSDRNFIAEMLLLGNIGYCSEYLFYRRNHAQSYVRSLKDKNSKIQWFDTEAKKTILPNSLIITREYLQSIITLPLPPIERMACLKILLEWGGIRLMEILSGDGDQFRKKIAAKYASVND